MRRQIQSSVRAGESVTRVAERLLDIDQPVVHLPQHVRELRDAAQMALKLGDRNIYQEAVKKWQGNIERLGQGADQSPGAHTMRSATQQLVRDLGTAKADQLEHIVDRWTVERARHQARVIARTETVEAFRDVYKETTAKQPYVVGYRWALSGGHPHADECDVYAGQDVDGLGPGGYLPENVPSSPHPHDLCSQVAIVDKDYFKRELAKTRGTEEPPKPWESGRTLSAKDWLKSQPESFQKRLLGPTLHPLFMAGRTVLDASGKPLPVHVVLGRPTPSRRLGETVDATDAIRADRRRMVRPFPATPGASRLRTPKKATQPKSERKLTLAQRQQRAEHWVPEYEAKYGPEVARSVAHGRASEHRGRATTFARARQELDALEAVGVSVPSRGRGSPLSSAQNLRGELLEFKTLGQAIDHYEKAGTAPALVHQLRASAALVGHRQMIEKRPAAIATPRPEVRANAQLSAERADREVARARGIYQALADAKLQHPEQYRFISDHNDRAFHRPAFAGARGEINLGSGRPGDVTHEWGHALETLNPALSKRALEFLRRRTAGQEIRRLADLHPRAGYAENEVYKPDEFIEAYVGKIYSSGSTEITSMMAEQFATDGGLEHLLREDVESFFFVLGQLAGVGL